MATGYFSNGTCYTNYQDALDMHYAPLQPIVYNNTTNQGVYLYVRKSNGVWNFKKSNYSSTGVETVQFDVPDNAVFLGSCNLPNDPTQNFLDGMELGWAVAGVMVVAFVWRRLRRQY